MPLTQMDPQTPASRPEGDPESVLMPPVPSARSRGPGAGRPERSGATRRAALLLGLVIGACGPTEPTDVIDRDLFIASYVDLRMAALDTDTMRLSEADRDMVLARHGVTSDDLIRFTEVHGGDLEFMRDVWNDVELALDRLPTPEAGDRPPGSAARPGDVLREDDVGRRHEAIPQDEVAHPGVAASRDVVRDEVARRGEVGRRDGPRAGVG